MSPTEYIKEAMRTAPNSISQAMVIADRVDKPFSINLMHASMGMVTEAAEFQDMLKKHFVYGKPFDAVNAVEEIGDILWYIALALDTMGMDMESVMEINIAKLKKRFPDKFTETEAIHRNVDAERKVLENANA